MALPILKVFLGRAPSWIIASKNVSLGIAGRIADTIDGSTVRNVLEIGPGIGTMTQRLCEEAREVVAVEIDRDLIPILHETLADYDNVDKFIAECNKGITYKNS